MLLFKALLPFMKDALQSTHRIVEIDCARTLALAGMVMFHFAYDLVMFGLAPPELVTQGYFFYHARAVAGSFLFLAGFGLALAHRTHIRWPAFWRRWIKIAGAAALVTLGTKLAMPEYYVFFGILHAIALFSILGLGFLGIPPVLTATIGAALIFGSYALRSTMFDAWWLTIVGLSTYRPQTVDFEPIFPWLGPFLIGLACAKLALRFGFVQNRERQAPSQLMQSLSWPGRHSLVIYLVHQPILMALVWVYANLLS